MKIHNTAIFAGDKSLKSRHEQADSMLRADGMLKADRTEKGGKNKKTIHFAGAGKEKMDSITQKKQQAQKKAMKLVGDVWDTDKKIDEEQEISRNKIEEYQSIIGEMNDRLMENKKKTETRTGEDGMQDKELQQTEEYFSKEIEKAQNGIAEENANLYAIRQGKLKSQAMLKADQAADKVVEAAGKEIYGMLMNEAKEHIDEKLEEEKEAARKKAEAKEAEEKAEEKKAEKSNTEKPQAATGEEATTKFATNNSKETEEDRTNSGSQSGSKYKTGITQTDTQSIVDLNQSMKDVQKEVKKILKDMKLTEEDLKGAAVDVLE